MYVETRGPTLEEVAKILDSDDAEVAHVHIKKIEKESEMMITGFEKINGVRLNRKSL